MPSEICGARSYAYRSTFSSNDCSTTRSSRPASSTMSTMRCTSSRVSGPLTSSSMSELPSRTRSSIRAKVGVRWPENAELNHDPASSPVTYDDCSRATSPVPFVVRFTVWSCMTTGTPSALVCTSISTSSAPERMPAAYAASVFSGVTDAVPPRATGGTSRRYGRPVTGGPSPR